MLVLAFAGSAAAAFTVGYSADTAVAASDAKTAPPVPDTVGGPTTLLTDYALMRRLESKGLGFERLVGAKAFAPVVATIKRDLRELYGNDPRAGVGMRHGHRLFDTAWLTTTTHRFELVGIANRIDRAPFVPSASPKVARPHCGELRLIYRLAYRRTVAGESVESRLPMTVNVVRWLPVDADGRCTSAAKRWAAGLEPTQIQQLRLKSVEVNLQSIRWPSTLHPTLAGHAEYVLRVFIPDASGQLRPGPLEMTPDVPKIRRSATLKKELLKWLSTPSVHKALDDGVAVLPDKFLAQRAVSVTPRGLARPQNRPWKALLSNAEAKAAMPSSGRHIKSPAGLLRRLDTSTCQGCHQSRSVAGFHLVGLDDDSKDVDRIHNPMSPHLVDELPRRAAYLKEVIRSGTASGARGLSERSIPTRPGRLGDRCGLGDASFATWKCGAGLRCEAQDETELGVCVRPTPGVGDACQTGLVTGRSRGVDDRVWGARTVSCGPDQFCESNRVGFPGGMCTTTCDEDAAVSPPGTVCGGIPQLTPFNRCIARGRPFPECILNNVTPKLLAACSDTAPCRDDYICAKTPDGVGACLPPYFLFQLRVDGHWSAGSRLRPPDPRATCDALPVV